MNSIISSEYTMKYNLFIHSKIIMLCCHKYKSEPEILFHFIFIYIYIYIFEHPPLPEKVKIGNHTCRVWYASRDIQCKRCGGKTHKTSDSAKCDYYTPHLDHVQAFTNGRTVVEL